MATTNITVTETETGASYTGHPVNAAAWVRKLFADQINPAIAALAFADALARGQATNADATYLGLTVNT